MDEVLPVFLRLVDGARWIHVDRQRQRLFVWHNGQTNVRVCSAATAEELDDWPCDASAESAAQVVAERINQGY